MVKRLYCSLAGHRVNRNRVWDDQLNFRTNCERCGTSLLRDNRGWREFDSARDANLRRDPHPHSVQATAD